MLSFHESLSYGATLQCFALQNTIKKLGYLPEFIDFRRKECADYSKNQTKLSFKEKSKSFIIKSILKIENFLTRKNAKLTKKAFDEFKRDYLKIGPVSFKSIAEIYQYPFDYQTFITGSDQVWNPFNSILEVYGLGFAKNNANTIAYAASIGVSEIPDEKKEIMYKNICNVRHISCREYEGAAALESLLDRKIENTLDPTLLLSKDEWSFYESNHVLPERYVLCFFLGSLDYPRKIASKIAKKNKCKLIIIPGSPKDMFRSSKKTVGCGPKEFLELFDKASFICTDSFHGTAFAINFNKPFYSFCRRGFDKKTSYLSRLKDLLEISNLSERLIYPDSHVDYIIRNVDFSTANSALKNEREKSLAFLKKSLEE